MTFVVMEDLIWSLLLGVFPALDMVSPCLWPGSSCCQPPSLEAALSQKPSCHLLDAISSRVQGELSTGRGAALHSLSWAPGKGAEGGMLLGEVPLNPPFVRSSRERSRDQSMVPLPLAGRAQPQR